jgi:phage FluMu protein Com
METDKIIHEKYNFIEKCINNIDINTKSKKYNEYIAHRQSLQDILNSSRNQYMLAAISNNIDNSDINLNDVIDSLSILTSIKKLVNQVVEFSECVSAENIKYEKIKINADLKQLQTAVSVPTQISKVNNVRKCADCNINLIIIYEVAELVCPKCSQIDKFSSSMFEENYVIDNAQNNKFIKNTSVDRHIRVCLDHILANEPIEEIGDKNDAENRYGEKIVKQIINAIKSEKKILQHTTIYDFRKILKRLKLTKYNKNIPRLMKLVTGIGPPTISENTYQLVIHLFTSSMELLNDIKQQKYKKGDTDFSDKYSSYYSHYIYKILEAKLAKDNPERRVLYYIYLQSQDTINSHDADWFSICEKLGIKPIPTDKDFAIRHYLP